MFDKPHAKHTFGIELDGFLLKSAELSFVKGKETLVRTFSITLDSSPAASEHVNPLDMTEDGQSFLRSAQQNLVVSALDSDEVLIRTLDIKLKKEKDIDSVLAFQAEPLLPYPVENALLDRILLNQMPEGSQIAIIAARKDHVRQHVEKLNPLAISPDVISCVPVALAFFSKLAVTSIDPHFVLHLAKRQTTCALVKEGKLLAAQTSPIGLDALTHYITLGTPEIDFSALSSNLNPELNKTLQNWRNDITRLLYALSKQIRDVESIDILVTGEGAAYKNLGMALCKDANKQMILPKAPDSFQAPIEKLLRFAVPIGAALSALENIKDQVNFRQQEFAHPHPWRHLKKPIALYFVLCLALAFAFYLFGKAKISHQEDQIRQEYVDLLSTMNKSYPSFEKEFSSKYVPKRNSEEEVKPAANLTLDEITQRLQVLNKELKESPDIFPLFPNVPRASDVLAWLSTHPNVVGTGKEGQLLQIESISYTLVKRPELKKKQEKYQVKVEIEFSTATPKLAREFHDALIAPNNIVDPKGEVKWSSNRGKYHASFFLKDKTAYPSLTNTEG